VELPKNPSVVGCKELQEGGRHSEVEEVKVKTCGTTKCSWMQGIRLGSLWNYRGWSDASGGRCVDQGSSRALDLLVLSWGIVQGKVMGIGG